MRESSKISKYKGVHLKVTLYMYHALYGNLSPRSVIANESSLGKIGHSEQGIKQALSSFIRFWQRDYYGARRKYENYRTSR